MFLKKDSLSINGECVVLHELSALQRIELLEYLASEEQFLPLSELEDSTPPVAVLAYSIRTSARVVAMSLAHSEPEVDIEDLHKQVLNTWPLPAIGEADRLVKKMSGMLVDVPEDPGENKESVSLEKP
ncbi:phage minor tail protein G [Candidatus Symbiopectobacterium sp. NZEC127]|uniref:phage tail assembly chaperone G n=1 Tax=Candidatus Symbiopectobacterium sp. NZEC127 TaxID=2820472 RepID=UPI002226221D|nr:phage minor tail protein G [Candidatus Symbiopectobacterium sp. NZEC127]MCW2484985.1 phage minor tail protein G [Candidatus Symbiopectobacterium sp. NZEC127]